MRLHWQYRSMAKEGSAATENEDALAIDEPAGRAALCDGASEGWGSGPWAAVLAQAFVNDPPQPQTFPNWLAATRAAFLPVPTAAAAWYAEEKQAQGAFSTLLGLSLSLARDGGMKFHAVAVGDSQLVQVRGDTAVALFPLESSSDFSNRPALVGSAKEGGVPEPEWFAGRAEAGDRFWLLSDALAEWTLGGQECQRPPWPTLEAAARSDEAFAQLIQRLRQARSLKNDDSTLVCLTLADD